MIYNNGITINLLDIAQNRPSKFKMGNLIEINDDSRGTCETNRQIKFKSTIYVIIVIDIYFL